MAEYLEIFCYVPFGVTVTWPTRVARLHGIRSFVDEPSSIAMGYKIQHSRALCVVYFVAWTLD